MKNTACQERISPTSGSDIVCTVSSALITAPPIMKAMPAPKNTPEE